MQEALTAGGVTAFDWDVRSGLSRRSENATQILGFDPKQPFGAQRFLERVHPEDRAAFKELVHSVSTSKPSYAATFRYLRPDGREVWLEETAKAEFNSAGRFVRLKGLTLDITDRKHAEAGEGGPRKTDTAVLQRRFPAMQNHPRGETANPFPACFR